MNTNIPQNKPFLCNERDNAPTVYPDTILLKGETGQLAEALVNEWMLNIRKSDAPILDMYRDREIGIDWKIYPWSGEFAGKYLTSAYYIYKLTRSQKLYDYCIGFIDEMITYQDNDGYLGCFAEQGAFNPENNYLHDETWEAWAHYHVMTGLMLWHHLSQKQEYKDALLKIAELFLNRFYGENPKISESMGNAEQNLAVYHIFAQLYELTADQRYLDFAKEIEKDIPNSGDYINLAVQNIDFYKSAKPRWEAVHTVMGIAEMYHATGDEFYLRCAKQIVYSMLKTDVHNTGGFSSAEVALGDPFHNLEIETCCVVAFDAFASRMFTITGNTDILDMLERAHYNAALGAHSPTGKWATYNTPMEGIKKPNPNQGSVYLNCCGVNSPRGVGQLTDWMFTKCGNTLCINLFETLEASFGDMKINIEGNYPAPGIIKLTIENIGSEIALRIPGWSKNTVITIGENEYRPNFGEYFTIPDTIAGENLEIMIDLDFTPYLEEGGLDYTGMFSIYSGPILYGADEANNPAVYIEHDTEHDNIPNITKSMLYSSSPLLCSDSVIRWKLGDITLCDFYHLAPDLKKYRTWFTVEQ